MLPDDDEISLRRLMAHYQPEVPYGLATRIVANATAQAQKTSIYIFLRRAFSEWDYALNFKGAALAAFAMLGLLGSQLINSDSHTLDVNQVVLADPNWTEEL